MMNKFHNLWHSILKKELKASFISFESIKGNLALKIIKDKKTDYIDFKIPFEKIDSTIYQNTLNDLKSYYGL